MQIPSLRCQTTKSGPCWIITWFVGLISAINTPFMSVYANGVIPGKRHKLMNLLLLPESLLIGSSGRGEDH
jgi:hypothetical protein